MRSQATKVAIIEFHSLFLTQRSANYRNGAGNLKVGRGLWRTAFHEKGTPCFRLAYLV